MVYLAGVWYNGGRGWKETGMDVRIERAVPDDADSLIEVQNRAFFEDYVKYGACPGYGNWRACFGIFKFLFFLRYIGLLKRLMKQLAARFVCDFSPPAKDSGIVNKNVIDIIREKW